MHYPNEYAFLAYVVLLLYLFSLVQKSFGMTVNVVRTLYSVVHVLLPAGCTHACLWAVT